MGASSVLTFCSSSRACKRYPMVPDGRDYAAAALHPALESRYFRAREEVMRGGGLARGFLQATARALLTGHDEHAVVQVPRHRAVPVVVHVGGEGVDVGPVEAVLGEGGYGNAQLFPISAER